MSNIINSSQASGSSYAGNNFDQSSMGHSYGDRIVYYKKRIIFSILFFAFIAAAGLQFLDLTTDNRVFFGPNNPQLLAFEAFEDTYTESNNVMVVFAPNDKQIFSRKSLAAIEAFTSSGWKLPHATRVDSLTNFPHSFANDDMIVISELVENANQLSDHQLDGIQEIAMNEPLLVDRLVSSSGHVGAAVINFILPEDDKNAIMTVIQELRKLVSEIKSSYPNIEIYLTGDIVLGATVGEATEDDVSILIPMMLILIFITIGLLLRSISITMTALAVIVLSALTALGIAGWLGYILNPGSAIAPTIILTIAIADSVHIVSNMLYAMRQGLNKQEAILESLKINLFPIFLTSVTTAAGFLTLNFSDSPPFNDLGNIVALGAIIAFIYSVVLLPALLMLVPIRVDTQTQRKRWIESVGEYVAAHPNRLIVLTLSIIILTVAGLPRVELSDDWIKYFDERYTFRTDSDFIVENLTGIETLEFSLPARSAGQINDPEYLSTMDTFAEWLRKQPGVNHVFSLTDILKRLNKNMHGDDPKYYRLPDTAELAAQYLLIYEMSLPYGQDLNDRIDVPRSQTRLSAVGDFSSTELRDLERRSIAWLQDNAPEYMVTSPTGMSTLFAHISKRNIQTMLLGSLFLLAVISVVLILVFRSFKYGIISLIPNLVPASMAIGLWGWFYQELGMAVAVVGAMTLGIIVDDTIHFLTKYIKAKRELGLNGRNTINYVFRVVGEPLSITTISLVVGFGILSFSGFQVNWAMGLLSALTISLALLVDFLLLPSLLMKFDIKQT